MTEFDRSVAYEFPSNRLPKGIFEFRLGRLEPLHNELPDRINRVFFSFTADSSDTAQEMRERIARLFLIDTEKVADD